MSIKRKILIFILILISSSSVYSQIYMKGEILKTNIQSDTNAIRLNAIEIFGNEKTKDYIIRRELYFDEGESVKFSELSLAQKRLLNLFLFNRVIFDLTTEGENYNLAIHVSELWYIFPVPVFYLNERSWSKLSYGAKLLYYNFLGRNILLNLSAAFGYNPEWKFSYRNPWFGGKLKLFTNISIYKSRVRSKTLEFEKTDDKRTGINWLLGRRFGKYFYLSSYFEYVEIDHPLITMSRDKIDKISIYGIEFKWDNRDLIEYPHKGFLASTWLRKTVGDEPINYLRYGMDVRSYIPVTRETTLALRSALKLSQRNIPFYDRSYFGYAERIRGRFYEKYEGENLFTGNIEFRFPIKRIQYLDLSEFAIPGFESYYENLKYGLSGGIFYDFGKVWFQKDSYNDSEYLSGFGAGLHIHMPYVDVFRLEVAFDPDWNHELIAEVAVAF